MSLVVFMRGVNVGGHRTFKPTAFAQELSAFDVVNVGAAGTFVVRKTITETMLRAELVRRLPVKAEFMICPSQELIELVCADPFQQKAHVEGVRRVVSVLATRPSRMSEFPFLQPTGRDWQVKVIGIRGRFALSLYRRLGKTILYPNEVVEKELHASATTRTWDTIWRIHNILQS